DGGAAEIAMSHHFQNVVCAGWRGLAIVASALVAGCSVAGSSALRIGEPSACTSDLGAYYLPKHHVTIALKRKPINGAWIGKDGKPAYELAKFAGGRLVSDGSANAKGRSIKVGVQPDPELGFCLDYVAVPTAKDRLIVQRDARTGLLKQVATK